MISLPPEVAQQRAHYASFLSMRMTLAASILPGVLGIAKDFHQMHNSEEEDCRQLRIPDPSVMAQLAYSYADALISLSGLDMPKPPTPTPSIQT